jgi:hypothetical protein
LGHSHWRGKRRFDKLEQAINNNWTLKMNSRSN